MFQLNNDEKTEEVVTICDHLAKLKYSPTHDSAGSQKEAPYWLRAVEREMKLV